MQSASTEDKTSPSGSEAPQRTPKESTSSLSINTVTHMKIKKGNNQS